MKVVVQQFGRTLFLQRAGQWTNEFDNAMQFPTAVAAIAFCIQCQIRNVRLLGKNEEGADVYFYPFGGDPAVKSELKALRKGLQKNRQLKEEQRMLQARIDIMLAETKQIKKEIPFRRASE